MVSIGMVFQIILDVKIDNQIYFCEYKKYIYSTCKGSP